MEERLDSIEAKLQSIESSIDDLKKIILKQEEPLKVMETHVHNVRQVVKSVPLLRRMINDTCQKGDPSTVLQLKS